MAVFVYAVLLSPILIFGLSFLLGLILDAIEGWPVSEGFWYVLQLWSRCSGLMDSLLIDPYSFSEKSSCDRS